VQAAVSVVGRKDVARAEPGIDAGLPREAPDGLFALSRHATHAITHDLAAVAERSCGPRSVLRATRWRDLQVAVTGVSA
jgi:hypothetical protein